MDKKKKINTLNDPIAKASRKIMKGIGKAGDFVKSSVTKGFKSYMGTKVIHLTNANVSGIQNGKGKSRKSIIHFTHFTYFTPFPVTRYTFYTF